MHGEKQVQELTFLESPVDESPSIKGFISERMPNPEGTNELIELQRTRTESSQNKNALQRIQNYASFCKV